MDIITGTYVADATETSFTGCGWTPDIVMVTDDLSSTTTFKTAHLPGTDSKSFNASGVLTTAITSLDADGFTIGTHLSVNNLGRNYYWIAMKADSIDMAVGTYTGDGNDDREISGIGWQPDFVWVQGREEQFGKLWYSTHGTADHAYWWTTGSPTANMIQAVHADGFEIGSHDSTNKLDDTYYWLCFKIKTGNIEQGTYLGNSTDDRQITQADAFTPEFVMSQSDIGNQRPAFTWTSMGADNACLGHIGGVNCSANWIQEMNATGFELGSAPFANGNGINYNYLSMVGVPICPGLCVDRETPLAWRSFDFLFDRVYPLSWQTNIAFDRELPISWKGCLQLIGKALGLEGLGLQLGGGNKEICTSLFNRIFPLAYRAALKIDRQFPMAWKIPFLDVDRVLALAWALTVAFDRECALAWLSEEPWTPQGDGESDLWIDQAAGEADLWVDQAAGEADLWVP